MRFGINLRGDLAKLDDAELGSEFERLVEYRIARFGSEPMLVASKGLSIMVRSGHSDAAPSMLGGLTRLGSAIFGYSEDDEEPFIWLSARSRMSGTSSHVG